ncbi:MAG: POTRA domain-containing protein, partial [Elusimicrobiaceae bacterium]
MRMARNKFLSSVTALAFACLFGTAAFCQTDSRAGQPVSVINITGNKTSPAEILSRLSLKKGKVWSADDEAKSKKALHDMGVFRKVSLQSRYDAASNGVIVDITADDGWYLVPLPLFTSGSSGRKFSVTVLSGNLFRRAETIFLRGLVGDNTRSIGGGLATGSYFFAASGSSDSSTERAYSDGAYNTLPSDPNDVKTGTAIDSYLR